MRPQQPRAEAVDRGDQGGLRGARVLALAELDERPRSRPFSSAAAFSVNVMARIRSTATPSSQHRAHEPLDQHARLAAARARVQEQRAVAALDGLALLGA